MKCSNFSKTYSIKSIKNIPKSKISKNNYISPYIIPGKINQQIIYDPKYSLNNFIPILDNKNQIRTIGSGSFGNVFLFKNTIDDKIYAIKHMEKKKLFKLLNTLNGIYREIDIQSKIEHENIIKILYSHESKESFNLVMEYAQNGSLFHYIRRNNGLSESQTFQLFIQVVNAVYFLHKNNLIHRDIKPENILLFNNDDENDNNKNNFLVKLCDFGWCVKLDEGESRKTFCGTTEYMSPELIDRKGYSKEIDVWSLGILLYEMIHGFSPFRPNKPKFEEKEVFENIKKHELKFGENVSERCKNLIINLLALNKNKRYKVEDIYNSEFVKYYENNNYCIPKCNKIKIELKENNENKKIKKSFSKMSDNTRYRNGVNNLKKFNNSYISKIPSKIYSMIYTKRNSNGKSKDKSNIIHLKKSNKLFKENSFSFIDIIKKESKNKRNKNINRINKVNSKFNLNTEKIYIKTNGRNNTKSFDNFQKQKSIPNIKSSDNILNKTKNKNKIQMNKKIGQKRKIKEEKIDLGNEDLDTIKSDLFTENFIKFIMKDFKLNNTSYTNNKSPKLRNLLFESKTNTENKINNYNFQFNNLSTTSTKRGKDIEEKNKQRDIKKFKISNINIPKKKIIDKNKIYYITRKLTKSNSFNLKNNKKNNGSIKQNEKHKIQKNRRRLDIKIQNLKSVYYSQKNEKMYVNKINNINYQNNNINNFYIINNTNINSYEQDYIKEKEKLFENYLNNVRINSKNNNITQLNSSRESEKNETPIKNKDNIKINPVKLLGDFKKKYAKLKI